MANDCPYGNGGKHPKGLSGCGCSNDPEQGNKPKSDPDGGKTPSGGKHVHKYETTRTRKGPVETYWEGLRRRKRQTTYYFEHCSVDGCPQPDRVVPLTNDL